MAEKFDPYHAWLGIPKWDQPANAYRLLGVEIFEKNRTVIEAAANRQMAYLHDISAGDEHIDEAQKLLSQISRARVILLNPEKKKAYDKKLSARLDALPEAEDESRPPAVPPSRSSAVRPVTKKEKSRNRLTLLRTSLLAVVGLLAIVIALLVRKKPLEVQVYEDRNGNGQFDPGEGVRGAFITEYDIKNKLSEPTGYTTDYSGIVAYPDLPPGKNLLTLLPPYEIIGDDSEPRLYVEVEVGGQRLFAQNIQIPVRKKLRKKPPPKSKPVVRESQPPHSQNKRITIKGQIFFLDGQGERQGREATLFLDLNGDEAHAGGREPVVETSNKGTFGFQPVYLPVDGDKVQIVVHRVKEGVLFQNFGPIPVPLADAKEGTIVVPIELEHKLLTISGRVKLQDEDKSFEGITVYFDRNENEIPDEGEPKTQTDSDGEYTLEFPIDSPKDIINLNNRMICPQPPEGDYTPPVKATDFYKQRNDGKMGLSLTNANFVFRKKPPVKPPEGNPANTEEQTAENEGESDTNGEEQTPEDEEGGVPEEESPVVGDPETNPEGFLRQLGFEPKTEREGEEDTEENNKPIWIFKIDPDLLRTFNKNKKTYSGNAKKGKWNTQIPELESQIKRYDAQIEKIFSDAKTKTEKKAAPRKAQPYDEKNMELRGELEILVNARDELLVPLIQLAEAVNEQNMRIEAALEQKKDVQKAADQLEISIEIPDKRKAKQLTRKWRPAVKFIAEQRLRDLGLSEGKRGWVPEGVVKMLGLEEQLKQIVPLFDQYRKMQQDVLKLIKNSAEQSQIDTLQKKVDYQRKSRLFQDNQRKFNDIANRYLNLLSQLQSQRNDLETNKDKLEETLRLAGGNYKTVIGLYPSSAELDKKREAVSAINEEIQ